MTGDAMSPMTVGPSMIPMMAVMMLPSALPAVLRRAGECGGGLAAPCFAGAYAGIWALVGLVLSLVYRPLGPSLGGALVVLAGLYELTPLKLRCRRRCRESMRSGVRFGVFCLGSSVGLMLVLVGLDVMSPVLMAAVAAVVLFQKLVPPLPAVDRPLALAIVALGVATAVH